MTNLIAFRPANERRRLMPGERAGQILFFTGVRYQRMSEDQRTPAAGSRHIRGKRQAAEGGRARKRQG